MVWGDRRRVNAPEVDIFACQSGLTNCSGLCANLQGDNNNCGSCGNSCKAGQICSAGTCALSCQSALQNCSGTCVNLQTDNANCGGCAASCKAGQVCAAGTCTVSCQTGLQNCSGTCVNLQTDYSNCGACGNACSGGSFLCCSAKCITPLTDSANCGGCGKTCATGKTCAAAACVSTVKASCAAIKAANPAATSGVYSIKPAGATTAFAVYCEMTTAGGGWTLVLMTASSGSTFGFSSALWTNTTLVSPTTTNPGSNSNMKNAAFSLLALTRMRLCLGSISQCVSETIAAASARAIFAGPEKVVSKKLSDYAVWQNFSGWVSGCQRAGFNVRDPYTSTHATARYGILLNNESACEGSVDGGIGFGLRGYYGTQISAGSGDGVGPTSYRRGWIFVRQSVGRDPLQLRAHRYLLDCQAQLRICQQDQKGLVVLGEGRKHQARALRVVQPFL